MMNATRTGIRPLAQALLRKLLLAYVLLAVGIFSIQLVAEYRSYRHKILDTLQTQSETFAAGAAAALWNYQDSLLRSMTSGIGLLPTVVYVEIRSNEEGHSTVWRKPGTDAVSGDLQVRKTLEYTTAGEGVKNSVGTLIIASSDAMLWAHLREVFLTIFLTDSLLLFALGLVLWLLVHRLVVAPLAKFSEQVMQLTGHEQGRSLDLGDIRVAEIDTLQQGFNQLMRQISESRERIEEQNAGLEQKVAERTSELAAANRKAEEATRAKSLFLANMSHEIRTPMNAIIGLSNLALGANPQPKIQDYLSKIYASSRALLTIINDILDYSKVEAGRMDIEAEEFQLESLLQNVSDLFAVQAEEKGLELAFEIGSTVPCVLVGDAMRLSQVMNNLVGNAVKFTRQGEVHVRVCQIAAEPGLSTLSFQVCDTGIGMSEAQRAQLFQPFTQADGSITRRFGGTGLGLAISKRLVEMMGGQISVESRVGHGSTFSFTLSLPVVNKERILASAGLRGMRVLVVDDLDISRQILREIFTAWGFRVEEAESGAAALEQLMRASHEGQPFELVLMDWKMPVMDGIEVTRAIRDAVRNKSILDMPVVIMVTAFAKEHLMREAQDVRLDAVLTKPVLPSALQDTVMRLQSGRIVQGDFPGASQPPSKTDTSISGARVLLVEDHEINQMVAREFLENSGLKVSIAHNGKEGVLAVRDNTFDAVLMDIHMPVMDGLEAARLIRANPRFDRLPIIAMTAAVLAEDREAALAAGMNDHVGKPILPDELMKVLTRWIAPGGDRKQEADALPACEASSVEMLPGFDFTRGLLQPSSGNQASLERMLLRFREEFSASTGMLENFMRERRMDEAVNLLHKIKGVAGSLGATDLSAAAAQLERALAAGSGLEGLPEFERALSVVLDSIARKVGQR